MAIKESAKDWYKEMHGNSLYANMVDGIVPTPQVKEDTVVKSVVDKYQERSDIGKLKYGKTLDRKDLSMREWLTHLQEDLMDATLYVEKRLKEMK